MTERNEYGFSWLTMFTVTGISGFGFSMIIKFLDGHHSSLLLWTGVIATVLAGLNLLINYLARSASKKKDT